MDKIVYLLIFAVVVGIIFTAACAVFPTKKEKE